MTTTELDHYRQTLEAKQRELSGVLRNRDEIVIEKAPDPIDSVQLTGERELAIRTLDRDTGLLRQVRTALFRITNQTYGLCVSCEEDISPKRLKALPWAHLCIACQEKADAAKIHGGYGDLFEEASVA